ncbi:MAG: flippase-like domain-containing protein [Bacteroidales bacterium]|nr:flippase-like domain-containing protein [Bacteroidales bacterium]
MFKRLFNIFLYLSLAFLGGYLYRMDYFDFRTIRPQSEFLVLSLLLLWLGFFMSTVSWWNIMRQSGHEETVGRALVSHGLSVFAKYIPGKIWVVLGRAGYLSQDKSLFGKLSLLSLKEQLIYVWMGLIISVLPMLFLYGLSRFTLFVLLLLIFLTLSLYVPVVHKWAGRMYHRVFRKEMKWPVLEIRGILRVMGYIGTYWIIWILAFYLLVASLSGSVSFGVGFAFPLSVTLGLLAIIFPGGLGIREGIMTGYLVLAGIPLETAASISVCARIWFISGELFLFLLSLAVKWAGRG